MFRCPWIQAKRLKIFHNTFTRANSWSPFCLQVLAKILNVSFFKCTRAHPGFQYVMELLPPMN